MPPRSTRTQSAYGGVFWLVYLANTSLMVAVSILFRYADFVSLLGGSEMDLGLIAGIGTVGGLSMRVFQGVGIDRYGPRLVWLTSLGLFVVSLLGHLMIVRIDSWAVYVMRILMTTSLAGAFGASITYISLRVPEPRMAEIIGTLGSSGFVGIALGPTLGDFLFDVQRITRFHVDRMFVMAAAFGAVSLVCAWLATRGHIRRPRRRAPPAIRLLRRYHPGMMLLVAAAMGVGIGLPHTFVKAYAADLGLHGIKSFFLVYAATAFAVRMGIRGLPQRYGVRPMILAGMASLAASMLLYLVVGSPSSLAAPAVMGGVAHAFLFPAVVAGGSTYFPSRYRGLATTLMLAMFDVGNLIGQPVAGSIIEYSPSWGLPPYATMYVTMAVGFLLVGAIYGWSSRKRRPASAAIPAEPAIELDATAAELRANST